MTLWVLCEHGEAKAHAISQPRSLGEMIVYTGGACPGGCPPTDEELIGELVKRGVRIGDVDDYDLR